MYLQQLLELVKIHAGGQVGLLLQRRGPATVNDLSPRLVVKIHAGGEVGLLLQRCGPATVNDLSPRLV